MSLCRFLPTPSDRMGILWSLLPLEGSVVLEYGPAGTTHYSMGLFGRLGVDLENHLFTTHMSEDDVVMGDTTRLEKAIQEIDEAYAPKVMFVLASSVSSVIGTDVKGVCAYVQKDVKAKLIPLEEGGFKGDYAAGVALVNRTLVKELSAPSEPMAKTFNLLGASMGSYRIASDVQEIARMMEENFGFTMHTSLCTKSSVDEIATMSGATVNLVLTEESLDTAKYLEKTYGTPYVLGMPYGYQGTLTWLQSVSDVLGVAMSDSVKKELEEKNMEIRRYAMFQRMLKVHKPTAFIYGEYGSVSGLATFLSEMSVALPHLLCKHSLKLVENPVEGIVYHEGEKERMEILRSLDHVLVFGDDISLSLVGENNTKVRFSTPFFKGANIATHLPFMGQRGADFIREAMEEYLASLK